MSEIREALSAALDGDVTPTETAAVVEAPVAPEQPVVEAPAVPRSPDGKFAPKAAETPVKAAPTAPEAQKVAEPAAPVAPEVKAPQAWKPALREKWAALPPDVREEVARREREVSVALSQSAEARRMAEAFNTTLAPYRNAIQGEPMAVVGNLLQTAHALQTGTPQAKAALVAHIVNSYNVDLQALDAALSGQAPARQAAPQEFRDPRLDQFLQQQEAFTRQRLAQQVADFEAKHEFVNDVRATMADLIDVRARQGVDLSLEDAYALAVKMHPEVSGVIAQREAAKAAATQTRATQRAQNASSSVRNEAAPNVAAQPDSMRGYLEAAMSKHSAR